MLESLSVANTSNIIAKRTMTISIKGKLLVVGATVVVAVSVVVVSAVVVGDSVVVVSSVDANKPLWQHTQTNA